MILDDSTYLYAEQGFQPVEIFNNQIFGFGERVNINLNDSTVNYNNHRAIFNDIFVSIHLDSDKVDVESKNYIISTLFPYAPTDTRIIHDSENVDKARNIVAKNYSIFQGKEMDPYDRCVLVNHMRNIANDEIQPILPVLTTDCKNSSDPNRISGSEYYKDKSCTFGLI